MLAVRDEGRHLEAAITLQWAPRVSAVDERARFLTDGDTRLNPSTEASPHCALVTLFRSSPSPRRRELAWVEVTKLDIE
ncbi:MAG: hypothetical protein M3144_00045 [Actinomycetota bacterium]|nr:hypothetical protein [Actinomycetota bacterium]